MFWFLEFSAVFCTGFSLSSWVYLLVVSAVGDFQMGSLSGPFCLFVFLVFLLTVRLLCCRTAGSPLQTLLAWGSPEAAAEQ